MPRGRVATGPLRWMRRPGFEWHLSFTGEETQCGIVVVGEERALKEGPPDPACGECKQITAYQLGLPRLDRW